MLQQTLFGLSVAFSFVAWSLVARDFVWPALNDRSRADALRPLLILHSFRFVGLSFLIPGVVSPDLPVAFAAPAAYGDVVAMLLALLAFATLRSPFGVVLVWSSASGAPRISFTRSSMAIGWSCNQVISALRFTFQLLSSRSCS